MRQLPRPAGTGVAVDPVTDTGRQHSFFVHYVVVGLVGSLLVAIGALGVGWLPVNTSLYGNPVVMALRTPGVGVALARFCVIVGMALLLQAWRTK